MKATGQPLIEGNLAIDLVNTEEIRRGVLRDFIESPADFSLWLTNEELAGAISKVQLPFEVTVWSSQEMGKVRQLRGEVREFLDRASEAGAVGSHFVGRLEAYIERAPLTLRLHEGRVVSVPVGSAVERLCSLVAADVFRLIGEGKIKYLRRCGNPNCLFMFLDESGRRKWCSMRRCGNRAKVVKHLTRKTSDGSPE